MSDEAGITVTFKAGGGYEAPWIVVRGDNAAEVREHIQESFNLKLSGETLDEAVIEGNRWLQGQYEAAKTLTTPPPTNPAPAAKKATPRKGGVASKARALKAVQEPDEVSDTLEAKIASAENEDAINALYKLHKAEWSKDAEKYKNLALARREELQAA